MHMATPSQIKANRRNSEKRGPSGCGPRTEEGKARSCRNRLSHGFTSSALFIPGEEREEFNLLLADLQDEFQPATPYEQILLEKMLQNQWLSLRAVRLQAIALNATMERGYIHKDLGQLMPFQCPSRTCKRPERKEKVGNWVRIASSRDDG